MSYTDLDRKLVAMRRADQDYAKVQLQALLSRRSQSPTYSSKYEPDAPAFCAICLQSPFHVRTACPSLANLDGVQERIDFFSRPALDNQTTKDILRELAHFKRLLQARQQREIYDLVLVASRQPKRRSQTEHELREQDQLAVSEIAPSGVFNPAHNFGHICLNQEAIANVVQELSRRDPTQLLIGTPPEFIALKLPQTEHECQPDLLRAAHGMSPWWPWFPPPPLMPMCYMAFVDRVKANQGGDHDRLLIQKYEEECSRWCTMWPNFYDRMKEEKRVFSERCKHGIRVDIERNQEEFEAATLPRYRAGFDNARSDPTAPPLVRGWVRKAFSILEVDRQRYPGAVYYTVSNANFRPRELPSLSPPVRRTDGNDGEHTPTWFPQWHVPGEWYQAFHDFYLNSDGSTRAHSRPDKDFLFYRLDDAHLLNATRGREGMSINGYKLCPDMLDALNREHLVVIERIQQWRRRHHWAVDFPHAKLVHADKTRAMLCSQPLSKRHIIDTLAGYQRALGMLRAWCNYHHELRQLLHERFMAIQHGRPYASSTTPDRVGPYRGVYVSTEPQADLYAQLNVFTVLITKKQELTVGLQPQRLFELSYATEAYSDNGLPIYAADLRPTTEFSDIDAENDDMDVGGSPKSKPEDIHFESNDNGGGNLPDYASDDDGKPPIPSHLLHNIY